MFLLYRFHGAPITRHVRSEKCRPFFVLLLSCISRHSSAAGNNTHGLYNDNNNRCTSIQRTARLMRSIPRMPQGCSVEAEPRRTTQKKMLVWISRRSDSDRRGIKLTSCGGPRNTAKAVERPRERGRLKGTGDRSDLSVLEKPSARLNAVIYQKM